MSCRTRRAGETRPAPQIADDVQRADVLAAAAAEGGQVGREGEQRRQESKDFILFPKSGFDVMKSDKDNTGERKYVEEMVFPTLKFPSDHWIVSTTLKIRD